MSDVVGVDGVQGPPAIVLDKVNKWFGSLHVLRDVKDGSRTRPFDLEKDLAGLDALIEGIKDLQLIAIDAMPVSGGRGAAAARKTEALFAQLAALARLHGRAILRRQARVLRPRLANGDEWRRLGQSVAVQGHALQMGGFRTGRRRERRAGN